MERTKEKKRRAIRVTDRQAGFVLRCPACRLGCHCDSGFYAVWCLCGAVIRAKYLPSFGFWRQLGRNRYHVKRWRS